MSNEHPQIKAIERCRVCANPKLVPILSLGEQYVSDFVSSASDRKTPAPLDLVLCETKSGGCGLLQLKHTTPPDIMYAQYWYMSGINESMKVALRDITASIERVRPLAAGDRVLDIGCNDGTLLRSYAAPGIVRIGIDPAKNLPKHSSQGTDRIINDYFNAPAVQKHFPGQKMKAITAIAMFYDLDDPNTFVADIAKLLDPEGLCIIQMSYLPLMLETTAFDNICHEHLEYYSLAALERLLARHKLEAFDCTLNDVNGGSFRVYIRHAGASVPAPEAGAPGRLTRLRLKEQELHLEEKRGYAPFVQRVEDTKRRVVDLVRRARAAGKKVYVYGASTKGNTLLQTFGLDHTLIEAAAERNPDKYGKFTVGTLIPIISEEEARKRKPDYFLVLPWHFMDTFIAREKDYLASGGRFIVPLPTFRVLGADGKEVGDGL